MRQGSAHRRHQRWGCRKPVKRKGDWKHHTQNISRSERPKTRQQESSSRWQFGSAGSFKAVITGAQYRRPWFSSKPPVSHTKRKEQNHRVWEEQAGNHKKKTGIHSCVGFEFQSAIDFLFDQCLSWCLCWTADLQIKHFLNCECWRPYSSVVVTYTLCTEAVQWHRFLFLLKAACHPTSCSCHISAGLSNIWYLK